MAITSWTNSYTNNITKAFIIPKNTTILFTVNSGTYTWLVNKNVQLTTSNIFSFTSSNLDEIWEIYVYDSTSYIKWVITTIPLSEAPVISEYFLDNKYSNRDTIVKDSWGRPLKEWTAIEPYPGAGWISSWIMENGFIKGGDNGQNRISLPSSTIYGTWEFKMMWYEIPVGSAAGGAFQATDPTDYRRFNDTHAWIGYYKTELGCEDNHYSAGLLVKADWTGASSHGFKAVAKQWRKVKIIHYQDNKWKVFENDILLPLANVKSGISNATQIVLEQTHKDPPTTFRIAYDNINVWNNKYINPPVSNYVSSINSIEVKGDGNTLSTINQQINNPTIFSFDGISAICSANIIVKGGAELFINNETLLMNPISNDSIGISCKNIEVEVINDDVGDGEIYINNSTIDSTNNYSYFFRMHCNTKLRIINSTLNKIGAMRFQPLDCIIENSSITGNTSLWKWEHIIGVNNEVDHYEYGIKAINSTINLNSFSVYLWDDIPNYDYTCNPQNLRKTYPVFKDSILNITTFNQSSSYHNFSMLNTKENYITRNLTVGTNNYINYKYYLDINVIDLDNNPIKDVIITVTNEIDNIKYPSFDENGFPLLNTLTDISGHTPLPMDSNSFVITSNRRISSEITNYTYSIKAEKGTISNTITNLLFDSTWYRTNVNTPTKTITIQLPIIQNCPIPICNIDITQI